MANQALELQASLYMYDLDNSANEYGFKADEGWQLSLATEMEKLEIEKKYRPTISLKVLPEILTELFGLVKAKLIQAKSNVAQGSNSNTTNSDQKYLIAFNPQRYR